MIKMKKIANTYAVDKVTQKAVNCLEEWGITELKKCSSGEKGDCWKCPLHHCNLFFKDIISIKTHYLKDHNPKPYACHYPDCTWSFPTKNKLDRHGQAHELKKWFSCQYEYCNKSFKTNSNLKHHIKKVHEPSLKFACNIDNCSAVFHNQKGLECHRSTHEGAIPEYSCRLATCGKSFFTNNALSTHMNGHERNTSDLICKICGKKFGIPCRFRSHMLTHEITKPFQCQEIDCTFSFLSQSKLKRHMETHSEIRKFICSFQGCSKAFKRKEHVMDHERSMHLRKLKTRIVLKCPTDYSPVKSELESIINPNSSSSSPDPITVQLPCIGSARTSLVYHGIIEGKLTMRPNNTNSKVACSRNMATSGSKVMSTNNMETLQVDAVVSVEQDLMLSSTSLPDSSSLSLQEELLSQEYFPLDSTNRLSDFEPSTINLRDLE